MSSEYLTLTIRIADRAAGQFDFDQPEVTLGRHPGCDVVLHTSGISRIHAVIQRRDSRFLLLDKGSLNGTLLNERKIEKPTPLTNGDLITILDCRIEVRLGTGKHDFGVEETVFVPKSAKGGHVPSTVVAELPPPPPRTGLLHILRRWFGLGREDEDES
ncbi:MAG: hypothetical protein A2284_11835 [Deltaproteobacteria bacterium RIFOXYA12_FULL_61_11]|nr:MAG: hypothetical protein A2284_11835 [Deltaproteobacteria bacterium RIFOXYA12_FULL_61_11]